VLGSEVGWQKNPRIRPPYPSTARRSSSSPGSPSASTSCGGIFDYDAKRDRLDELDAQAADPNLWDEGDRAQEILKEQAGLKQIIEGIDEAEAKLDDARTLYELGREEQDTEALCESWRLLEVCDTAVGEMEFRRMLAGEHDAEGAIMTINAGAGGVDSQDWAEILLRMYQRWGERRGYRLKLADVQEAEQAGIRSAELVIEGDYVYGHLRSEIGVHRLVRISPFDAAARRHTSFASVMVVPDIVDDAAIDVEILDSDLKVDTYRASGKGGQHVNKTDSAVRLTHLPTGIVVACQAERSQHKNHATAMHMLRAKLIDLERQKIDAKMAELRGTKMSIEWGSQVRSYVLQPFQQVNDHRTGLKQSNVEDVLDGDLDSFIVAYLLREGGAQPH
jgi:peptide chain release factor 2